MKISQLTRRFAIAIAAFAMFSAAGMVQARTVTPGAACVANGKDPAAKAAISISNSGISNRDDNFVVREVICPVVRVPGPDGVTVFIDGAIGGSAPMKCSVASFNFNGNFLAVKLVNGFGPKFDAPATFSAAEAPTFAYLSASCFLPAFNGSIFGVIAND